MRNKVRGCTSMFIKVGIKIIAILPLIGYYKCYTLSCYFE